MHVLPPKREIQYALYTSLYGYIDKSYFHTLAKQYSKVINKKTGGVNAREKDLLINSIERAKIELNQENAICLDEKVFVPRVYDNQRVCVGKDHTGYVPSPKLPSGDRSFFTLQMAISINGIVYFNIIDGASNIDTFNQFLRELVNYIPNDAIPRFLVLDNGKFHLVSPPILQILHEKNIKFSFNAPMACFLNPIEEFFSFVVSCLEQKLMIAITQGDYCPTKQKIIAYVHDIALSIHNKEYPLKGIFTRACILPPIRSFNKNDILTAMRENKVETLFK